MECYEIEMLCFRQLQILFYSIRVSRDFKKQIPTASRSKNWKSLTIKDFQFSLLHFWRVFGEIDIRHRLFKCQSSHNLFIIIKTLLKIPFKSIHRLSRQLFCDFPFAFHPREQQFQCPFLRSLSEELQLLQFSLIPILGLQKINY